MIHKKHWPLWAAGMVVVGAGGWWAVHAGSPPVQAVVVRQSSRAVAHTTALGAPATPAPVTRVVGGRSPGARPPLRRRGPPRSPLIRWPAWGGGGRPCPGLGPAP